MDIAGQLNDYYTVGSQGNRWNLVVFYYIFEKVEFKLEFVNDSRVLCARNNNGSKS